MHYLMKKAILAIIAIILGLSSSMSMADSKERWAIDEWVLSEYKKGLAEVLQLIKEKAPEGWAGTIYCADHAGDDRYEVVDLTYDMLHSGHTMEDMATAIAYEAYYVCEGQYQRM